jgi:hypothetical protein
MKQQNNFTFEEVSEFMVNAILSLVKPVNELLGEVNYLNELAELTREILPKISEDSKSIIVNHYNLIPLELITKFTTDITSVTEEDLELLSSIKKICPIESAEKEIYDILLPKIGIIMQNSIVDKIEDKFNLPKSNEGDTPSKVPTWMVWDSDIDSDNSGFLPKIVVAEDEHKAKVLFVLNTYDSDLSEIPEGEEKSSSMEEYLISIRTKVWDQEDVISDFIF